MIYNFNMMKNIFNYKNVAKESVAGKTRHFDRTYYINNNAPNWTMRNYENFANVGYVSNVIANRAINLIAKSISSIAIAMYTNKNGQKIEILEHEIIDLLKKPNPLTTYTGLIDNIVKNLLISGNAYVQKISQGKNVKEIDSLRPDRINIMQNINGIPNGYRYKVGSTILDFPCNQETGASDILHIKTYHPLNDWYGLSSMESAQYSIDQHNECIKWNKALLENGARPSGALVVKQNMTNENYARLKEELDDKFAGGQNAGKVMVLEGGIEWQEIGINPKDMDFIETKNSAARDIAIAFGVPSQLLGIKGDNTYSNMTEARLAFWEETVIPTLQHILSHLSMWLSNCYNMNIDVEIDYDSISILTEKRRELWQSLESISFLTINEKRAMLGFGEMIVDKSNVDKNYEILNALSENSDQLSSNATKSSDIVDENSNENPNDLENKNTQNENLV